jgi:uncharacterized protein
MIKPRGSICNLECQNCFYLSKKELYPQSSHFMAFEILEQYTKEYKNFQKVPEVIFG